MSLRSVRRLRGMRGDKERERGGLEARVVPSFGVPRVLHSLEQLIIWKKAGTWIRVALANAVRGVDYSPALA